MSVSLSWSEEVSEATGGLEEVAVGGVEGQTTFKWVFPSKNKMVDNWLSTAAPPFAIFNVNGTFIVEKGSN